MSFTRPGNIPLLFLLLGLAGIAQGAGPADPLLKLVPADAGVTIALEDLSGQTREFSRSDLAQGLRRLPAFNDWTATDRFRDFKQALTKAETLLGEPIAKIRDEIFGEAVVLTLRLPLKGRPEEARGLLLARVPNRALLEKLIDRINTAAPDRPRLARRERNGTSYQIREFAGGVRPDEFYASLDGEVFAWSNSEDLMLGAIDRQAEKKGSLADVPAFRQLRERLPRRALISFFIDPRFAAQLMEGAPRSKDSGDERWMALLSQYLRALRYAGLAVESRDGIMIHTEEVVDPTTLASSFKRWAGISKPSDSDLRRLPPSALMMATARLDFQALLRLFDALANPNESQKYATLYVALEGLLLGLDLRNEVLPSIGPGVTAYIEQPDAEPGKEESMPFVLSTEIGNPKVARALENAARTLLALHAIDDKNGGGRLRLETHKMGAATVTALSPTSPLAFAVTATYDRFILGSSSSAVARALAAQADPEAGRRVERLRAEFFPEALSFAAADLRAIYDYAFKRRPALARQMAARQNRAEADAARDLDQALALIHLFDAAFVTSQLDQTLTRMTHKIGLVNLPETAKRP